MNPTGKIIHIGLILILLCLSAAPTQVQTAQVIEHDADDALLLMATSYRMLDSESAYSQVPKTSAVSPQSSFNEIDILIDMYVQQITRIRQIGYDNNLEARLLDELEEKISSLRQKAQAVAAERKHRRRGGIARFFRALGRGAGWVMGRVMEGAGKVVQYGIEEVTPQLIKDAVLGGSPLTATAFRATFRRMLQRRIKAVIENKIENRVASLQTESDYASTENSESDQSIDSDPTCPPFEVITLDIRNNHPAYPDVVVYANSEEVAPPAGYQVSYSPFPDSAAVNTYWRLLLKTNSRVEISTTEAVTCAGVFLVGHDIASNAIYLNGELISNSVTYAQPIHAINADGSYPENITAFRYIRASVHPPVPVTVTIVNKSDNQAVPVFFFGFDLP